MLGTGSNTSLLSKKGSKTAGAVWSTDTPDDELSRSAEESRSFRNNRDNNILSPTDEDFVKNLQVHTVRKACSNAKNVPRKSIDGLANPKSIADKLHLSGGAVHLLVGTDFVDAFIDIHTLSGDPGEPAAKRNCFR